MQKIDINDYNYPLSDDRIAKFPLSERSLSKLLHYHNGEIMERRFAEIGELLPSGAMLVFNNTKVIRARIIMHKPSGARIEIFCLEPHSPSDYERAFAQHSQCEWSCIVGNLKKWKSGHVEINFEYEGEQHSLKAYMVENGGREHIIHFEWSCNITFGQLLELLGKIPIPPYLNRESEEIDYNRYQTVYSKFEGSVAAPTAGLHFSEEIISELKGRGISFEEVTLHVGAGTFLPVKEEDATKHPMHTEHFDVTLSTLIELSQKIGRIVAVGTTSVRTLESLSALAYRVATSGDADLSRPVGQWELYDIPHDFSGEIALRTLIAYMESLGVERVNASTQIMITPLGYRFRVVKYIITNFHQPKSTLLLLVSAYVGESWREIYQFALNNDFRFLSYGDSSLLMVE
ncbi:MAG: S-adenosylmethionine:tRNA ribosyltransferase-isomerase [Rikenellaceae bacterium]